MQIEEEEEEEEKMFEMIVNALYLAGIQCRICEELVAAVLFEEHSKFCAQSTACEKRVAEADDRLQRIISNIEEKIQENTTSSPDKVPFSVLARSQLDMLSNIQRIIREAINVPFSLEISKALAELSKQVRVCGKIEPFP